jgi:transcription elongation factor Elf1
MESTKIIQEKIQEILNSKHSNRNKRIIAEYPNRLNFACPICGDSKKSDNKKRGNVYFKNMHYKCFNCGVSFSLTEFFKQLNVNLDPTMLLDINRQIDAYAHSNISNTTSITDFSLDKILTIKEVEDRLNNSLKYNLYDFKQVDQMSKVGKYLRIDRKVADLSKFYQAIYRPNVKYSTHVLVNLNYTDKYIIGFQIRNLNSSKDNRFYKIYSFEDLYNFFPEKEPLTEEEKTRYNKLSYCYNILNVDFGSVITLFEGYIDSIFYPNSIGLVGTNTDYSFLLDESLDVKFFFDNDKAGLKKTKEMIMKGYSVFLWDKFIKDLASKSKNPNIMYYKLKKELTDLNKVAQKIHNPYKKLKLEQYFSVDALDVLNI